MKLLLLCCGAGCPINDALCERDWIGFEAIAQLHAQIDDDHNGSLDRLESNEVCKGKSYSSPILVTKLYPRADPGVQAVSSQVTFKVILQW